MALPKPVWSNDIIRNPSSLNLDTWNNDPTTLAVLRALASCHARLGHESDFGFDMVNVLAQQLVRVVFSLLFIEHGGSALLNSFQVYYSHASVLLSRFREMTVSNLPEGNE